LNFIFLLGIEVMPVKNNEIEIKTL
jgi:hypothetical protein